MTYLDFTYLGSGQPLIAVVNYRAQVDQPTDASYHLTMRAVKGRRMVSSREQAHRLGRTGILRSLELSYGSLLLICCAMSCVLGYFSNYGFLSDAAVFDGFRGGIKAIERLLNDGRGEPFLSEPLLIVHLIRYMVAKPFLVLQDTFGSVGPLVPILVLMVPLLLAGSSPNDHHYLLPCRLLIVFAPLFVSGRTILVAIGAGYLCLGALRKAHPVICFTLGISLATLSSAAVFVGIAILTLGAGMPRTGRELATRAVAVATLAAILMPSQVHKIEGFREQKSGYQKSDGCLPLGPKVAAQFSQASNPARLLDPVEMLTTVASRSTLVRSLSCGDTSRFVVYSLFAAGVLLAAAADLRRRKWHALTPTILLASCAFFAEGLGVWTLLFPLAWRFTSSSTAWSSTSEFQAGQPLFLQTSLEDIQAR